MNEKTRASDTDEVNAVAERVEREAKTNDRFTALERRLTDIELDMRKNTDLTQEIRDVMTAAKVGFKVLGGVGIAVKWAGIVAGGALALYTAFYTFTHGGIPPKP